MPFLLSEPVIIADSLSKNDSVVVVTNDFDTDDNPVLASIKPNGKGRYQVEELNSNYVTSYYGRNSSPEFLKRLHEQGKLLYCNKNKTQEMFERWGEQYSELTNSLVHDIIIHQSRNIVKGLNKTFQEKEEEKTMAEITLSQEQLQELIQNAVSSAIKPVQEQLATVQAELRDIRKNQKVIQAFMTAATAAKDCTHHNNICPYPFVTPFIADLRTPPKSDGVRLFGC